jgi:mRNA interferase RelE/StbE
MKPYQIVSTRVFTKDFRRLPYGVQLRILDALEEMLQDPYRGSKVQALETGIWRWRVGDYRIRYDIEGEDIVLLRVRHRREIYRG